MEDTGDARAMGRSFEGARNTDMLSPYVQTTSRSLLGSFLGATSFSSLFYHHQSKKLESVRFAPGR